MGTVDGEGRRSWQEAFQALVRRGEPQRRKGLFSQWLDAPDHMLSEQPLSHTRLSRCPSLGHFDSTLSQADTRPGSIQAIDLNNDSAANTPADTPPRRPLHAPACLHSFGVSALKDSRYATAEQRNERYMDVSSARGSPISKRTVGLEPTVRNDPAAAADGSAIYPTSERPQTAESASLETTKGETPRMHVDAAVSRLNSACANLETAESTGQAATGVPAHGGTTAQTLIEPYSQGSDSTASSSSSGLRAPWFAGLLTQPAQKAASPTKDASLQASSPLTCFDCSETIVGTVYMLNDRPYCCQRHRLNSYHRLERTRMAEREVRITSTSMTSKGHGTSGSQMETPTGFSLPDALAASGTSGVSALYPAWI